MSARLHIKVVPGSSRNKIAGMLGDRLKVAVSAAPEAGKANAAVIALLAETLALPSSSISIVQGSSKPQKTVEFATLSQEMLNQLIGKITQK